MRQNRKNLAPLEIGTELPSPTVPSAALTRKEDRRAQSLEKELGIETPDADKIETLSPPL